MKLSQLPPSLITLIVMFGLLLGIFLADTIQNTSIIDSTTFRAFRFSISSVIWGWILSKFAEDFLFNKLKEAKSVKDIPTFKKRLSRYPLALTVIIFISVLSAISLKIYLLSLIGTAAFFFIAIEHKIGLIKVSLIEQQMAKEHLEET